MLEFKMVGTEKVTRRMVFKSVESLDESTKSQEDNKDEDDKK